VKKVFMEELAVQQAQGDHAEESPVQHALGLKGVKRQLSRSQHWA